MPRNKPRHGRIDHQDLIVVTRLADNASTTCHLWEVKDVLGGWIMTNRLLDDVQRAYLLQKAGHLVLALLWGNQAQARDLEYAFGITIIKKPR